MTVSGGDGEGNDVTQKPALDHNSAAVQKHLEMVQDVIARMAENSRSCKLWCVTLVAATLVFVARTGEPRHALIALVPTLLFLFLDSYYLALERAFNNSQDAFVAKMHGNELNRTDVFEIAPVGMGWRLIGRSLLSSTSILPFYPPVTATILLAWLVIL